MVLFTARDTERTDVVVCEDWVVSGKLVMIVEGEVTEDAVCEDRVMPGRVVEVVLDEVTRTGKTVVALELYPELDTERTEDVVYEV